MAFKFNPFKSKSKFAGPAFLMATAAIGPGFITQTTVFSGQFYTSFGFVILISILLDIIIQLNIWQVIAVSGKKASVLANEVYPGMGILLVGLIAVGGLVFNIGNIGGTALALESLFGFSFSTGALVSGVLAIIIFLVKEFGSAMDFFTKILGFVMIFLMLYVALSAHPPVGEMVYRSMIPEKINVLAIITLVGGTVGGYISFAGAHRMLDSGISGQKNLPAVNKGAVTGIMLAGIIRILLFSAVIGVLSTGFLLPAENPAAAVFEQAAGQAGLKVFGVILWCAAMTSVVAAAYTSVSFIVTLNASLLKYQRHLIVLFILLSTSLFLIGGSPTKWLVMAGTFNGLVLPLALITILMIANNKRILPGYHHSRLLLWSGWVVTAILTCMSIYSIFIYFSS